MYGASFAKVEVDLLSGESKGGCFDPLLEYKKYFSKIQVFAKKKYQFLAKTKGLGKIGIILGNIPNFLKQIAFLKDH